MYDTKKIHERLAPLEESTRAGYYGAILAIVKSQKLKKSVVDHYQTIFDIMLALRKARATLGERTEKQASNWMTWEEVCAATRSADLNIQQRLIGALYTLIPPRRNADYLHLQLNSGKGNWYASDTGTLYFTNYKTANTYGKQHIQAPPELITIINDYVRSVGLQDNDYFFGDDRSGYKLTRLVNSIFKKKIGPTMLRHIYLTGKYGAKKEEMLKDAAAMAHSSNQQAEYIIK